MTRGTLGVVDRDPLAPPVEAVVGCVELERVALREKSPVCIELSAVSCEPCKMEA